MELIRVGRLSLSPRQQGVCPSLVTGDQVLIKSSVHPLFIIIRHPYWNKETMESFSELQSANEEMSPSATHQTLLYMLATLGQWWR